VAIAEIAPVSPIASAIATLLLIAWMLRTQDRLPLDVPNERSLHARPVPRMGGIAMMAGVFSGFAILQTPLVVVLPAAVLVALSHFDDLHGLPISIRLGAQLAAATGFAYGALPGLALPLLAPIVVGIMWVTNLYNFMDGSDGLAGGMTVFGFFVSGNRSLDDRRRSPADRMRRCGSSRRRVSPVQFSSREAFHGRRRIHPDRFPRSGAVSRRVARR